MKKLRSKKGETLFESLVAFAILAVIMIGFPMLIVNVNRLNKSIKDHNISYNIENAVEVENIEVSITHGIDTYKFSNVHGYKDSEEEFYFYGHEKNETNE